MEIMDDIEIRTNQVNAIQGGRKEMSRTSLMFMGQ